MEIVLESDAWVCLNHWFLLMFREYSTFSSYLGFDGSQEGFETSFWMVFDAHGIILVAWEGPGSGLNFSDFFSDSRGRARAEVMCPGGGKMFVWGV